MVRRGVAGPVCPHRADPDRLQPPVRSCSLLVDQRDDRAGADARTGVLTRVLYSIPRAAIGDALLFALAPRSQCLRLGAGWACR